MFEEFLLYLSMVVWLMIMKGAMYLWLRLWVFYFIAEEFPLAELTFYLVEVLVNFRVAKLKILVQYFLVVE